MFSLRESKNMNQSDAQPSANYVTCRCQHCDTGIEFNAAELAEENSVVPCPHCGLDTKLFIPQTTAPQDSVLPTLPDSELEAFADRFTTEKEFLKERDTYDIETRKKLSAIWNRRHPMPTETELNALMDGLTLDEYMQVLKIANWDEKMAFLKQLQKTKGRKIKIVSINNELELADDSIIIRRHGVAHAMAAGLTGERIIPISTITAIQLKLGVWWSPGFILFSYAGSKPFMGGIIEATQDPDAFIFQKELNDEVSAFKVAVEKILRESKQRASSTPNSSGTLTDEIRKLADLKQQGVLSQEEFEAAKKKLFA
jgi:Short C-terminal domain